MLRLSTLPIAALATAFLLLPAPSQICSTAVFGSSTADPLFINSNISIPQASCTFDFAGRHVILGPSCTITVQTATFNSGQLTMQGGSIVRSSNGGTIIWNLAPFGPNDGSASIAGLIDVNDPIWGGSVVINAATFATITGSGRITARGTSTIADGGTIDITAGGVVFINGSTTSLDTSSGNDATGGDVTLISTSASVETYKRINCDGGAWDGGTVWIDAATYVSVNGPIDCSGAGGSIVGYGWGGFVDLYAGTEIVITDDIKADGPTGDTTNGGGDGGDITLDAGTLISIASAVQAEGGTDGLGGTVDATSGTTFTQGSGLISVRGKGSGSTGGDLTVIAGTTAALNGSLDVSATSVSGSGGNVTLNATGDIALHGTVSANANVAGTAWFTSSQGGILCDGTIGVDGTGSAGRGGDARLVAFADLNLASGVIDARGYSTVGIGGTIFLSAGHHISGDATTFLYANGNGTSSGDAGVITIRGCRVSFPSSSRIWARSGPLQPGWNGGQISITANDVLTLSGLVQADYGSITLRTRLDAPWSPVLTGATITPAPVIQHDGSLVPCLAVLTTTLSAVPLVPQGGTVNINLQSVPNKPLLIVWNLAPGYQTLGPFGYTQVSFLPAPSLFPPLADYFRLTGHPSNFPGGSGDLTDASGLWTYFLAPVIAPSLIGITITVDAYVIDSGAENGLFHQPVRVSYTFI